MTTAAPVLLVQISMKSNEVSSTSFTKILQIISMPDANELPVLFYHCLLVVVVLCGIFFVYFL